MLEQMKTDRTIEEKTKLFDGKDHWHLNSEKEVTLSDGPNGLRIEDAGGLGFNHAKKATVFPTAASIGCSFDRSLLEEYGRMIAEECISEKVDVILGPGVNTKRSPLCGRSFEYFSEDPVLSGEYAASYINGVQSMGIGTSLKHYAANSCELGRQVQDSIVDERTLHELYLRQFETAVRKGHPWSLMTAYNRLNGVYCCENQKLMDEARSWGFNGIFISDWGGVSDPVRSYQSGLNVEMPGPSGAGRRIAKAAEEGTITKECIERSAAYMDAFIDQCGRYTVKSFDQQSHDDFCERAAEESIVLLKNSDVLPLRKTDQIAVIGPFAIHPSIQGSGSSQVNPKDHDWLLKALDDAGIAYAYAQGYSLDTDKIDEALSREAVEISKGKDKVIILVGESPKNSGEGFDRSDMDLALNQNALIRELIKERCQVIAVVQTGSPVTLPWRHQVSGIIAEYEAGCMSGIALKKILYGEVNPSGHLAETWPLRCEDVPCSRYYDQSVAQSQYREGIYAGYRYYDTFHVPAAYSFGYGMSYTEYSYADLQVQKEGTCIHVSLKVKNTGSLKGRAVIQLYAGMKDSRIARPDKELKDFASVSLDPGEEKEVQFSLAETSLQYYDVQRASWQIEKGTYTIMIGKAVDEITLKKDIEIDGIDDPYSSLQKEYLQYNAGSVYVKDEDFIKMLGHEIPAVRGPRPFTQDTTVRELKACGLGRFVNFAVARILNLKVLHGVDDASIYNAPIRQLLWIRDYYTWDTVDAAAAYFNHHGIKEWNALIHSLKKKK
jgi:beta-glucosidase